MKLHITNTFLKQSQSTSGLFSNVGLHRDTKLTGFGVRITPTSISFIVEAKNHLGKSKRKTLGRYPLLSVSDARTLALSTIQKLKNPAQLKKQYPKLQVAYKEYLGAMNHKPKTVHDYKNIYNNYLNDWSIVTVDMINRDMIIDKYVTACERSIAQANKAMKLLQAIIRFSGISDNPVTILAQRRFKKHLKPKTSYVPPSDLKLLYKGLGKIKDPSVRFNIELLIHTGLRANEAMQITSYSVATGVLIITDTKNHSDHYIPLTQWLTDNLIPFLEVNPNGFKSSDIRKSLIIACQYLDYTVTRHDLRRTFASYASEAGCDYLIIKRALNHTLSDITAKYIQTSASSLIPVFDSVAVLIQKNTAFI